MAMHRLARHVAQSAAAMQMLIGLSVSIAWLVRRPDFSVLVAGSNAMVFNTSISFVMAGAAVLALSFRRRAIAVPLALAVFVIAMGTLAEYLFALDLQIDQLILGNLHPESVIPAQRMAPNTATAFLMAAAGILVMSWSRHIAPTSIAAVLGSLTLAVGMTALIGYAFELEPAYEWGWMTRMAALTALSFSILGASLLAESVHRSEAKSASDLPWLATAIGVASSLVTVIFWHVLRVILTARADDAVALHLPNALLLLGLFTAALLAGVIAQSRDLHRRTADLKAANSLISTAADRIRDLYDHAPCGYHSLDAEGVILDINETELDWLGYSREEVIGRKKITDLLTPGSVATFRERFPRFKETGVIRDLELELVRKDGSVLPALVSATAIFDAEGRFARSRSTIQDMTERRRIEQERKRAAEQLRVLGETIQDLYDRAPCGYHSLDAEGRIIRVNETEISWLGYSRNELVGRKTFSDLLTPESRERFEQRRRELAQHINIVDADYDLVRKDGTQLPVSLSMIPIFDTDGRITECRATVHDVAERRKLERELERRTQTDLLTGLATRRHFLQLADHELSRMQRHGGSMSLLMVDVDHFKAINDTHGHLAGDAVLTAVGKIMLNTLRCIDIAGRFGGEEFVVLLPSTDLAHAVEAAERLRQAIASSEIAIDEQRPLRITVSIGVANYDDQDGGLTALVRRADEAMYACKRSGRNCISASSRSTGETPAQAAESVRVNS